MLFVKPNVAHTIERLKMNPRHLVSLIDGEYTTVAVRFDAASKLYTYKTRLKLQRNDWVIVSVNDVLKVVQVVQVHATPQIDFEAKFDYKWVVQKVDMSDYNTTLAAEAKLVEHIDAMERLHKRYTMRQIIENVYVKGSPAHDYYITKVKPLLKD
jgi:hypothetical protein